MTLRLDLATEARLDRDVIVIVTPREPHPSLLVRADDAVDAEAPVVKMAAMQVPAGAARDSIAIKLLVDCSGSMNCDSIASARTALKGVIDGLGARYKFSFSRFGSRVLHVSGPSLARPHATRHFRQLVDELKADMGGGTEMESALTAVFALSHGETANADVLLVVTGPRSCFATQNASKPSM